MAELTGVWILDLSNKYFFASPSISKLFKENIDFSGNSFPFEEQIFQKFEDDLTKNWGVLQNFGKSESLISIKIDGDLKTIRQQTEAVFDRNCKIKTIFGNIEEIENISKKGMDGLSSSFLHSLIDAIPDSMFILDDEGVFKEYIPAKDSKRFRGERFLGKSFKELLPVDMHDVLDEKIKDLFDTGTTQYHEYSMFIDGVLRYFEARYVAIGNNKLLSIVRDITDHKKVESELTRIREVFRVFADYLPSSVFINNKESVCIYVNKFLKEHFNADEWIGKDPHQLFGDTKAEQIISDDQHALNDGFIRTEEKVINKFGEEKIFETSRFLIESLDSEPLIGGVALDITRRKKAENDLINQRDFLKNLMDAIPAPVFFKDLSGRYVECNKEFEDFFNVKKDIIKGKKDSDIWCEETEKVFLIDENEYEAKFSDYRDRTHHLLVKKRYIQDKTGFIDGTIGVLYNISRIRELESQLIQSQKMEAVGTFAGGIAHDFNNIISMISGYCDLALNSDTNTTAKKYVESVSNACLRAQSLVRNLMLFIKKGNHEFKAFKTADVMRDSIDLIRTSCSDIEINLDINSESLISGDQVQVQQIIMNLCTNSIHAMREVNNKILSLSLKEFKLDKNDNNAIYQSLVVEDSGCGIKKDNLKKIFDPYFTTKKKGEGTGLGLSVVKGIVDLHGGSINIDTKINHGTRIEIILPVFSSLISDDLSLKESSKDIKENKKILIVDDEDCIVEIFSTILSTAGYNVIGTTSSKEAYEKISNENESFDLLITDIFMPEIDGYMLAQRILDLNRDLPVIFCSGHANGAKFDKSKLNFIFLSKPVTSKVLMESVKKTFNID